MPITYHFVSNIHDENYRTRMANSALKCRTNTLITARSFCSYNNILINFRQLYSNSYYTTFNIATLGLCIACEFHQLWAVRPCIYHILWHLTKWLILCRIGACRYGIHFGSQPTSNWDMMFDKFPVPRYGALAFNWAMLWNRPQAYKGVELLCWMDERYASYIYVIILSFSLSLSLPPSTLVVVAFHEILASKVCLKATNWQWYWPHIQMPRFPIP